MKKFKLVCGIDISKSSLSMASIAGDEMLAQKSYPNTAAGLEQLYQDLLKLEREAGQILICLENTGVYMEKLLLAFKESGFFLWVVNPLMIKYARVSFDRLKTDQVDARKIAQFGYMMQSKARQYRPLRAKEAQMKDLFLLRSQLVKLRSQVKNFSTTNLDKAIPCLMSNSIWKQVSEQLTAMIKEVEGQLQQISLSDKAMKRTYQILRSIPGIGPVCAWQLIYTTQHFERFPSHKQFAAYSGTAPFEVQSGSSIKRKARISKKAAVNIKTNLSLAALRQIRKNMVFHQYYKYMKDHEHKHHLWIINSIRNMLIKLAFDLVKKDKLFDLEIFLKNKKSWAKFLTLS